MPTTLGLPSLRAATPPRRAALLVLMLACLGVVGFAMAADGPAAAAAPPAPAASGVRGWLTTPDRSRFAAPLPASSITSTASAGAVSLPVDATRRYQRMVGVGAALTDSSAQLLAGLPAAKRTAALESLFRPGAGAGISVLRVVMGASDFATTHYTYDDLPPGQTDPTLARFSIAHDEATILPILRQALAINPRLVILATPWSAPAWMKTNGSLYGGTLAPAAYAAYAQYFVAFVKAYAAAGVPVSALSVQNEPGNAAGDYPSMTLSADQEAAFVSSELGPALARAGLSGVKLLGYDHNWSDTAHPLSLLRSAAAPFLSGTAFHCYDGDPGAQTTVHDAAPAKGVWFTECTGGAWSPDFATNLGWNSAKLLVGAVRNWAQTVLFWNVALRPDGGPHLGGRSNCRGVLTIDPDDDSVAQNVEFAGLVHASSAMAPGAVRIGSPAAVSGVESVAFANPDGSRGIIVTNGTGTDRVVNVSDGTGSVIGTALPGGSTLTLRWSGKAAATPRSRAARPSAFWPDLWPA